MSIFDIFSSKKKLGELRRMKEQKSELELAIDALTKQKEEITASYQAQVEATRLSMLNELDALREQCEKQKAEILSRYKRELEEERMRIMGEHYAELEKQLHVEDHTETHVPETAPEPECEANAAITVVPHAQEEINSSLIEYDALAAQQEKKSEPVKPQTPRHHSRRKNITNSSVAPRDTLTDKPKYEYSPYTYAAPTSASKQDTNALQNRCCPKRIRSFA